MISAQVNSRDSGMESGSSPEMALGHPPMSRTHQYRKVMKPLLERKRRARINKCLDELKDLMVVALQHEGESITKLEKADVLELTVRHMQKLKSQNALGLTPQATYAGKFKAGYAQCAQEVSKFMQTQVAGVDVHVSGRLLSHLNGCIRALEAMPSSTVAFSSPPTTTVIPTTALTPPNEDQALDLSSKKRPEDSSDLIIKRPRQMSNDSDSGSSSAESVNNNNGKCKEIVDDSWRPW